jgi:hypothetical protein
MSPEIDQLLCELSASLTPTQRFAFEAAARTILATIPECQLGPGVAFRAIRDLQKLHFDAPPDLRASAGARHNGVTKLQALPAVGQDDPRCGSRARRAMAR